MKNILLGKTNVSVPAISVGCMRLNALDQTKATDFINNAIEHGATHFDHADIYGKGECEVMFGKAVKDLNIKRDEIFIQSKCGIVPGIMYDFSYEHITTSVDGILSRLGTDYLDMLLLHRPDALIEPEIVAKAFDDLYNCGKVKAFGVSNMKPMQIELIKKYSKFDIQANQLQLSVTNSQMIRNGMEVNMLTDGSIDRDGSVLDYCRLNDITIQAWSPFQYGFFEGVFLDNDRFAHLNTVINEIAQNHSVSNVAIASAWILRHPANIQMITGTTNKDRFNKICDGANVKLSREEWYKIYIAAGNMLP